MPNGPCFGRGAFWRALFERAGNSKIDFVAGNSNSLLSSRGEQEN